MKGWANRMSASRFPSGHDPNYQEKKSFKQHSSNKLNRLFTACSRISQCSTDNCFQKIILQLRPPACYTRRGVQRTSGCPIAAVKSLHSTRSFAYIHCCNHPLDFSCYTNFSSNTFNQDLSVQRRAAGVSFTTPDRTWLSEWRMPKRDWKTRQFLGASENVDEKWHAPLQTDSTICKSCSWIDERDGTSLHCTTEIFWQRSEIKRTLHNLPQ